MPEFFVNDNMNAYLLAILLFFAGLAFGFLFQKVVIGRLRIISQHTKWKGDDVIVNALGGKFILWWSLVGLYAAQIFLPIQDEISQLVQQFMVVLVIVSFMIVAANIAGGFVKMYAAKAHRSLFPATTIFTNLTKTFIYLLAGLMVLQTFGISITPLLTALGVGGLAVALALQAPLSNLFSGIHMMASHKFNPGDFVEIESGEKGYIEDISWINTSLRTLPNNLVVIPNSQMASVRLTNYSKPLKEMSILVHISVSYKSDLAHVEKVTIEVAREVLGNTEGGVEDFNPFIRFHTFGESGIGFTVILRVKEFVAQYLVKHEFVKALQKRYAKEGIEIPFPQRVVHSDGDDE